MENTDNKVLLINLWLMAGVISKDYATCFLMAFIIGAVFISDELRKK